jgi:hypothetical protein
MALYRKTRKRCSCGFEYPGDSRRRTCPDCGATRKPKHKAKHTAALDHDRAVFVAANDGYDGCWVCRELGIQMGGPLQRDHEHKGDGRPRGILCVFHNRKLGPAYTPELVNAYAKYLARPEAANQSCDALSAA